MGLEWLFSSSPKRSRRTSKKIRKGARVNINQRSVSVRVGGKKASATIGRRGVTARIFGLKLF